MSETTQWYEVEDTVVSGKIHAIVEARKMAEIGCPSFPKVWKIFDADRALIEGNGSYRWGDRHHTLLEHRVESRLIEGATFYRHTPTKWKRDSNVVIVPGLVYDAVEGLIDLSRQSFTQQHILCNPEFKDWLASDLEVLIQAATAFVSKLHDERDAVQNRFATKTQIFVPEGIEPEALIEHVRTDCMPGLPLQSAVYDPDTNCVIVSLEYARDLAPAMTVSPLWVRDQLTKMLTAANS